MILTPLSPPSLAEPLAVTRGKISERLKVVCGLLLNKGLMGFSQE